TGVRTWYAFNGSDLGGGLELLPFRFLPEFDAAGNFDYRPGRLSRFKHTDRLPLLFDGLWMFEFNSNMINARHNNRRRTNLLMADGHAESTTTKGLPNSDWYLR